jgi:hypothetical protein
LNILFTYVCNQATLNEEANFTELSPSVRAPCFNLEDVEFRSLATGIEEREEIDEGGWTFRVDAAVQQVKNGPIKNIGVQFPGLSIFNRTIFSNDIFNFVWIW